MNADDRLAAPKSGYLVVRRGRPAAEPFEAGDIVDVYPFDDPLTFVADNGSAEDMATAHRLAAEMGEGIAASKRLRRIAQIPCECRTGSEPHLLAVVVLDDKNRAWVIPRMEKVPRVFRSVERDAAPKAWPLHSHGATPHVEVVSCRGCGGRSALAISARGIARSSVSGARHARRVVD